MMNVEPDIAAAPGPGVVPRMIGTSLGPVAVWGEADTAAIVLLHANGGSSRDWDAVVQRLDEVLPVIRVDWPGFGASPAPPLDRFEGAMSYVDVLDEVLDALAAEGVARTILIGNSVGGRAALQAAAARPDRVAAVVGVAPGGFTSTNPATRGFCRIMAGDRLGRWMIVPLTRLYLRRRNDVTRAEIARARDVARDPVASAVHAAVWASFTDPRHDLRSAGAAPVPTVLTWGRWDPVLPARTDGRRAARVLGAPLHTFATGHEPFAERPDEWLDVVVPFLRSVLAGEEA